MYTLTCLIEYINILLAHMFDVLCMVMLLSVALYLRPTKPITKGCQLDSTPHTYRLSMPVDSRVRYPRRRPFRPQTLTQSCLQTTPFLHPHIYMWYYLEDTGKYTQQNTCTIKNEAGTTWRI